MSSIANICEESLCGSYELTDRLRVGGVLRALQQPGAVVNWMKEFYPGESRPLRHFAELTRRLRAGVEALVASGVPYLEARRVSEPAAQEWLAALFDAAPRAGRLVAIVRTIETVNSFSCRPRKHRQAKGDPVSGRRPTATAEHHLTRGARNVAVYYFHVYDAHWGRASIRISSYLPFDVTLQLNGHEYVARQMKLRRRQIEMAANAVAHVHDWAALHELADEDLEPAVRRFGAYWIARLPHGLTLEQIAAVGGYHWYIQVLEVCRNFVFRSEDECSSLFETLVRHNHLLGSPDSVRYLFGMKRTPRQRTSTQVTTGRPMGCFKAFYGSNWLKCYDKQGFILRYEFVLNRATDFAANKSLSNLRYLTRLGRNVCRRLERSSLAAVSCSVRAGTYKSLVEPGTDADGRPYPAIRPERPRQQALLATLLSLSHCANGFSNRELRAKHQQQHGVPLKTSQASYRIRVMRAHGLVEPVGGRRRYQLTRAGRPMVAFLVKLYSHLVAPVVDATHNGIHRCPPPAAHDPLDQAMLALFQALGIATHQRARA
jgi:hypothetical protein